MFLTELDQRAAVKGSRDPLGIQPIWTRLGRHVVGNLTTVSNTVTDFTTVLLGYHFAEEVAAGEGGNQLDAFLKWEQLAGYARGAVNGDWSFRGVERAKERFNTHQRATLGADRDNQIMSDQKSYGLWGLYTAPSVASGLLEGAPSRLTPLASEHVGTQCLPTIERGMKQGAKRVVQILARDSWPIDFRRPEAGLLESIAGVHKRRLSKAQVEFFDDHLVQGGPVDRTGGVQRLFAELLQPYTSAANFTWSTATVRKIARFAEKRGADGARLTDKLLRIADCESVMAPASAAFTYLLSRDEARLDEVGRELQSKWGKGLRFVDPERFGMLRQELDPADPQTGNRWVDLARSMQEGDFNRFTELLVLQNSSVMALRGGAPWIEIRRGHLKVKFRGDAFGMLPDPKEAEALWRHPYFLESLRSVTGIVRAQA